VDRPLKPTELALVQWVAQASVGDQLPEPWRWARNPMESVIRMLVDLEVMAYPPPGTEWAAVAQEAAAAARRWLDDHPQE
jgi:hypothetical protein